MKKAPRFFIVTWVLVFGYELVAAVWAAIVGDWASAVTFGLWAMTAGCMMLIARSSYRSGWLEGRTAMLTTMAEARKRGMTSLEWLIAEAERDGIPVTHQPVEPDDD
jgi:hypothetical protein